MMHIFKSCASHSSLPAGVGLIGALVFMASDLILAQDKFVKPVPLATLCVMSTYYTAQALLTLGAPPSSPTPAPSADEKEKVQ